MGQEHLRGMGLLKGGTGQYQEFKSARGFVESLTSRDEEFRPNRSCNRYEQAGMSFSSELCQGWSRTELPLFVLPEGLLGQCLLSQSHPFPVQPVMWRWWESCCWNQGPQRVQRGETLGEPALGSPVFLDISEGAVFLDYVSCINAERSWWCVQMTSIY